MNYDVKWINLVSTKTISEAANQFKCVPLTKYCLQTCNQLKWNSTNWLTTRMTAHNLSCAGPRDEVPLRIFDSAFAQPEGCQLETMATPQLYHDVTLKRVTFMATPQLYHDVTLKRATFMATHQLYHDVTLKRVTFSVGGHYKDPFWHICIIKTEWYGSSSISVNNSVSVVSCHVYLSFSYMFQKKMQKAMQRKRVTSVTKCACMHVCVQACVHVCVHVCVCAGPRDEVPLRIFDRAFAQPEGCQLETMATPQLSSACVCMHVCVCVCACLYAGACVCLCVLVCACLCLCMCTCVHTTSASSLLDTQLSLCIHTPFNIKQYNVINWHFLFV